VGVFSTPISPIDRTSIQKLDREIMKFTYVMNQMALTDIYRIFHPNTNKYTFSAPSESFSKTDQIVGHKASPS
jgi:exonuclease III